MYNLFSNHRFDQILILAGFIFISWYAIENAVRGTENGFQYVLLWFSSIFTLLSFFLYTNRKGALGSLMGVFGQAIFLVGVSDDFEKTYWFHYIYIVLYLIGLFSLTNRMYLKKIVVKEKIALALLLSGIFIVSIYKKALVFPITTFPLFEYVVTYILPFFAFFFLMRSLKRTWLWLMLYFVLYFVIVFVNALDQFTQMAVYKMGLLLVYGIFALKGFVLFKFRKKE